MHAAGKIFVKTCIKANRDTFRGTFKLLGLQENTLSPVPSLSGTSGSPHEENLERAWSVYCNDFLSKQKIYSM